MNIKKICSLICGIGVLSLSLGAQTLSQDTYVEPGSAISHGAAQTINVGGATNAEGLVPFDLSTLPAGTTGAGVVKASLILFVHKVTTAGAVNISVANGPCTEPAVNGMNPPVAGAAVASGVAVDNVSDYLHVDATQAVQNWLNGVTTNSGFIVKAAGAGVDVEFDSKESTSTSHSAVLSVVLASVGPKGATGATGPAGHREQSGLKAQPVRPAPRDFPDPAEPLVFSEASRSGRLPWVLCRERHVRLALSSSARERRTATITCLLTEGFLP